MQPNLLGNRPERLALPRQVADLLIAQAPVDAALGCLSRRQRACGRRGRREKSRRLDDSGLGRERQGECRGRHMDIF
jgi:hypothetical protein